MPPQINILTPAEGTIFNVYDTISVSVTATDETGLEQVQVRLVDANFISVGPAVQVSINEVNSMGSAQLIISDKLLETGEYHVVATAFDGNNEKNAFQEIRVIALPKERRAFYCSTAGQFGQIWKLDSLFSSAEPWLNAGQDILSLCVNSQLDRISLVGNLSRNIQTFNIENQGLVWSDQTAVANQIQRFTDILCFENSVYASLYDREIRNYSATGSLTMNELTGNYRPNVLFADELFLVVGMTLVGGNSEHIFVFNRLSRVVLWQQEIPMKVVAICPLENDVVMLFGNNGNQAKVLRYDIGDNAYWEPRQLPEGKVLDAIQMEGPVFAIAHETGLYSYTYSPNYLNQLSAANVYQTIDFDVDKSTIVGASRSTLHEIHKVNGQVLNSVMLSDSITSVDIHYTR